MRCACENKRMSAEIARIWRLAKAYAKMEGVTTVLYKNEDDTYGFTSISEEIGKTIVEYITPY